MLDECKGDKFEEVLVSFSTVVLQKSLAAETTGDVTIARTLALARNVASRDQEFLLPLAIAYKASLTATLRRKKQLKTNYSIFQHVLDQKEQDLAQKTEQLEAIEESGAARTVPNQVTRVIKRQFETHWKGDPQWVDIIVRGGEHDVRDPLLEDAFSEIWPTVGLGEVNKATIVNQPGLLQDLENKVACQQARMEHWKAIKNNLTGASKLKSTSLGKGQVYESDRRQGIDLDMSRHKDIVFDVKTLKLKEEEEGTEDKNCTPPLTDEYARLVDSMRAELSNVGVEVRRNSQSARRDRNSLIPIPLRDCDEIVKSDVQMGESTPDFNTPFTDESWTPRQPIAKHPSQDANGGDTETPHRGITDRSPRTHKISETMEPREQDPAAVGSGVGLGSSNTGEVVEDQNDLEIIDEDELLAQQIISSTRNAAPSPAKSKRSLAERTRQSMGFPNLASLNEIPNLDPPAMPPPPPSNNLDPSPSPPSRSTTLLERTRQSMSLIPSTSLRPRKSYNPRLSKIYPTNQFETPNKQHSAASAVDETTTPERLFTQEADYTSVFKSRPKIAVSPTVSPELREVDEIDQTDEFDEGLDEDGYLEKNGASPSMRRTGRVGRL